MITFTRGLDPRRAMGTGLITWDNITIGCCLRTTRPVEMAEEKSLKGNRYKFCTDRSKKGRTMDDRDLYLYNYTRVNNMIEIEYNYINGTTSAGFRNTGFLHGSLKQFQNHFEIVQKR